MALRPIDIFALPLGPRLRWPLFYKQAPENKEPEETYEERRKLGLHTWRDFVNFTAFCTEEPGALVGLKCISKYVKQGEITDNWIVLVFDDETAQEIFRRVNSPEEKERREKWHPGQTLWDKFFKHPHTVDRIPYPLPKGHRFNW
ncbi:hypothetical protein N0V90_012893 [Kalmusia sp. IMI 367209]|nr:hypothetical protein N0V90_012893 [Kalmusia sp. IMI 367209]